ncbi:Alpha/Beta hydrolase protein [Corynascus similis CBS 632.67]
MGLFRSKKKVKKNSPASQPKDQGRAPQYQSQPPPLPYQVSSQDWYRNGPQQQSGSFRPAGLLPPSTVGVQAAVSDHHHASHPPIIVNQHHYYFGALTPSHPPASSYASSSPLCKANLGSAVDLAKQVYQETDQLLETALPSWHRSGKQLVNQGNDLVEGLSNRVYLETHQLLDGVFPSWQGSGSQLIQQGNAVVNEISHRLNNVLTKIDQGGYRGKEHDIYTWQPAQTQTRPASPEPLITEKGHSSSNKKSRSKPHPKGQTSAAAGVVSSSFFAKADCYANSRLPMNLPPLKLYIPTYPLLCLAAQYSERVYEPPTAHAERDAHVDADWRTKTKAMVIKSIPMDSMNTIVFAIRGTATFMDWAVNLDLTPTSPAGFLDDPGNLCHAGFLSVARKMVGPVARRLRQLLEEDPGRASYSLLITGHSAGGAVAALLYSHMLATSKAAESELHAVVGCFKRIHCVTFGTPPVSLIPLTKPDDYLRRPQLRKSVFLSFVNEGDPVVRADKAYVKSLLELFAAPRPRVAKHTKQDDDNSNTKKKRGGADKPSRNKSSTKHPSPSIFSTSENHPRPIWNVPPSTLSCAGRIVVLRSGDLNNSKTPRKKASTVEERLREGVVAQTVTDEQLRGVIWGDPVAHMMRLYAGRIEVLAVAAVTGMGY